MSGQHHAPPSLPSRSNPDTHLKGAWVGSRANLGALEKRKISLPLRDPIPGSFDPSRSQYTDYTILVHERFEYIKVNRTE